MSAAKQTSPTQPTSAELLSRGVEAIYPSRRALSQRLATANKLTVYYGIDPSGELLHIGHAVALQKLRQFQQLGHRVVIVIGDFTGQTGDPTDKRAARQPLSKRQVLANAKRYRQQLATVLDLTGRNPATIRYNSEWLESLTFSEVAELAGHFTVQQMVERDMFTQRLAAGKPISLREFLYPLMQGYDSVALKVDLEIGGADQTFNMLAGRKLSREYRNHEKFVMVVPILADAHGVKIGKSEGNAIAIAGPPADLYGQLMALPDELIVTVAEWCTSVSKPQVMELARLVKRAPRDAKMRMAWLTVAQYHGEAAATKAEQRFIKVFQRHDQPTDVPHWKLASPAPLWRVLRESGLASSGSEARRLIAQRAVKLDGHAADNPEAAVSPGTLLQVGKKRFCRIVD